MALAAAGCISVGNVPLEVSDAGAGFHDDRTRIEVVSTKVGGKNIFIPSTLVFTAGSGRSLSFFNTTDQPHGMTIPGLAIEVVLPPQEEYVVELPALVGGNVYEVQCHLHPPHRGAALVVLPAQ
jgi:hypothetical protein